MPRVSVDTLNFEQVDAMFTKMMNPNFMGVLNKYGAEGVRALGAATPVETGETANSWYYEIEASKGSFRISWYNSNVVNGANVAVLIQFGHGTRNGGWVDGRDYINPALRPIFNNIALEIWKVVTSV